MEGGKSIGKLYCDVEISVNYKKDLTHREKMDKLIDDLDYLVTSELDALLATTKAFKEREELSGVSTKDLVEELKKRVGIETFGVGAEEKYVLNIIYPTYPGCVAESGDVPATILIIKE